MEANDYLLIDQYLQGELPEAEKPGFEQRLQSDAAFAAALQERQQMRAYLRHQAQLPALKERMADLGSQHFKAKANTAPPEQSEGRVVPLWRRKPLVIVAAAAAAIALMLLVWNPFQAPANLYEQYALHPNLALQERNVERGTLAAAEQAFNDEQYGEAYTQLSALTQQLPDNPQLRLALGIAALETDRVQQARTLFEALADGRSALKAYGQWYLALSYVKTGEYEQAKPLLGLLAQQPSAFQDQAAKLLQQL